MMQLCQFPMLFIVVSWTTVTHFLAVSPNSIFTDYSLSKIVQLELLHIRVNIPWCTSLFILVSLNILMHIYTHTTILTILDVVKVLPISLMYQNFNLQFTSLLSSLVSVLPLMLPLFGIHLLKTFMHHPLLPLLERSSKPISTQRLILLSSFFLMASPWCQPISVPGL